MALYFIYLFEHFLYVYIVTLCIALEAKNNRSVKYLLLNYFILLRSSGFEKGMVKVSILKSRQISEQIPEQYHKISAVAQT